ncbi:peptidoglycan editing factor PgeF [Neptunicella sp. SCSIO 80796]|uniref:peptidoglycan editing factor PgeF n=1 Tax=Neptunicella plasticusilytica TaxID=3117012 RepID=UPI003A4D50AC
MTINTIQPDWPINGVVNAFTSTRQGGVSHASFDSLNIAMHVDDNPADVLVNRSRLPNYQNINWLNQTHSNKAVELTANSVRVYDADASFSHQRGVVCAVMTADCLPVLLADPEAGTVAAVHAGWRGLADGVIENTVKAMTGGNDSDNNNIYAWLGPAIGANYFEVGEDVRRAFSDPEHCYFQHTVKSSKYLADIYQIARYRLFNLGIKRVFGGEYCTYSQSDQFYSYRRDGQTGRMVSCIWFD